MIPLLALLFGATVVALGAFLWDQARARRFDDPAVALSPNWVEDTLLRIPAEVAGAAWSDTVDSTTVKAILTRLVLDGTISAEVDGRELRLSLRKPRSSLHGYVYTLINSLFVSGDTVDRPTLVRDKEKRDRLDPAASYHLEDLPEILGPKTFDPAAEIETDVLEQSRRLLDGTWFDGPAEPARPVLFGDLTQKRETMLSTASGKTRNVMLWFYLAVIAYGLRPGPTDWERDMRAPVPSRLPLLFTMAALLLHEGGMRLADRVRKKPALSLVDVSILLLPLLGITALAMLPNAPATLLLFLYAGSLVNTLLRARSSGPAGTNDMRKRLALARERIGQALESPAADEKLLPYAIAFGLEDRISGTAAAFDACGGPGRWNAFATRLVEPIVTRSMTSYD